VLTYTNHALDQFLEDIQNAGIPASSIVRLGSKSSANTRALGIKEQPNNYKMSGQTSSMIIDQKSQDMAYHDALVDKMAKFASEKLDEQAILDFLEFSDSSEYFDAFVVPKSEDGMELVGRNDRAIDQHYLVNRWLKGENAGIFTETAVQDHPDVWRVEPQRREALQMQ
jgi:hypothetical protein